MTLVLDLPSDMEARLTAAAEARGLTPKEYTLRVLSDQLPTVSPEATATRALLRSWREEDAADDPARAECELAELKAALNDSRRIVGAPPLFR